MSAKLQKYEVITLLSHDNVEHEPGAEIELTAEAAAPLLRVGTLRSLGGDGDAPAHAAPAPAAPPAPAGEPAAPPAPPAASKPAAAPAKPPAPTGKKGGGR